MLVSSGRAYIALLQTRAILQIQITRRNKAVALLDGIQAQERQRDTVSRPKHLLPFLSTSMVPQTLAGLVHNTL